MIKGILLENKHETARVNLWIDNQMHMKTLPADFDHDGDIDIAILWRLMSPYYGW